MNVNFSTHNLTRLARWRWLLAVLIVLIVLVQSAAPAAYAFPVEPPPSCTVVGWGNNGSGQATPPAGLSDVTAIAAGGFHSLALKSDGTVVGWGQNNVGQATPPANLSDVIAIAAGSSHSLALKSDGTVVGWGNNGSGQATPPANLSDVIAIAAGSSHSLALKSDGTVVGWGNNGSGQATPPAGLSDVTAIAAGGTHSLALKSEGTVVGWGNNGSGQATPPAGLSDVTAIAAGFQHSLALKSDGTVVGWGNNGSGQAMPPAGLSDVTAIAAATAGSHSLALKSDGTVVGWGDNFFGQSTPPADLSDVIAIAGGGSHSLALQCAPAGNTPPSVAADNASVTVDEGQTATNTGTVDDPDGDTVTLSASAGTVVNNGNGTWSWSFVTTDGPPDSQTVTITADDGNGGTAQTTFELTVNNVAPSVGAISAPLDPQQVGAPVNASASFSDPGTGDTHTATWDWGDGNTSAGTVGSGTVGSDSHTYTAPGVYTIQLTVSDDDGGSGQSIYEFVVIYDPNGGFVTGGGWITSPAGAYVADPSLSGKANFGFNSKYKNGASVPTGDTEFQFKLADLNFKSTSYQWLVVAGAHAKYKGVGTINGSGNYGFMLTATDGQINGGGGLDTFRIKIWDMDNGDAVVYDNQIGQSDDSNAGTALAGGSIVIHK